MDNISIQEDVLNSAIASVEMEGYNISKYQRELCIRLLKGQIKKDEFIKIMLERCKA